MATRGKRPGQRIAQCVAKGINVINRTCGQGLGSAASNGFDIVVMTQATEAVLPDRISTKCCRVGRQCIITFPISALAFAAGTPQ